MVAAADDGLRGGTDVENNPSHTVNAGSHDAAVTKVLHFAMKHRQHIGGH